LNIFFNIQDIWATCACSENSPWGLPLSLHVRL